MERVGFNVDLYVETINNVPQEYEAALIGLIRAPHAEYTHLARNEGGVCTWDQTLRVTVTLFSGKDGSYEGKEYTLTLFGVQSGSVKQVPVASIQVDLADFTGEEHARPSKSTYFNFAGGGQLKCVLRVAKAVEGESDADALRRRNSADLKAAGKLKRMSMQAMGVVPKGNKLGRMSMGAGAKEFAANMKVRGAGRPLRRPTARRVTPKARPDPPPPGSRRRAEEQRDVGVRCGGRAARHERHQGDGRAGVRREGDGDQAQHRPHLHENGRVQGQGRRGGRRGRGHRPGLRGQPDAGATPGGLSPGGRAVATRVFKRMVRESCLRDAAPWGPRV